MTKNISITAFLTIISVILFTSQLYIPFIGIFIAFFSTIPIILINFLTEKRYTIMSIITSSILVIFLNDPFGWILYILFLIPSTVSNLINNKTLSYLMIIPVLTGSYILYSVLIIDGSNLELFFKKIWFIIGLLMFISLKYFFYKIITIIKIKYLKRLRKEI